METIGRVQDCGCIALTPQIQEKTGLFPGATFHVELTPDKHIVLVPLETRTAADVKPGAACPSRSQ